MHLTPSVIDGLGFVSFVTSMCCAAKRNQNLSRYYNFVTNLKFQHKQKYHLLKNPHIK
jgi:hypothetical protein